jgi:hypothetical protein
MSGYAATGIASGGTSRLSIADFWRNDEPRDSSQASLAFRHEGYLSNYRIV